VFSYHCSAKSNLTIHPSRNSALHTLLAALLAASQTSLLLSLPFPKALAADVDAYLATLATKPITPTSLPSSPSIPPHKILYAYRLGRRDLKGAATCLWTRLQTLEQNRRRGGGESVDEEVMETYLVLINTLSLVEAEDAWILTRPLPEVVVEGRNETALTGKIRRIAETSTDKGTEAQSNQKKKLKEKRKVLTLTDIRRLWQVELDRQADMEAGRFPVAMLGGADSMGEGGATGDEMVIDVFA